MHKHLKSKPTPPGVLHKSICVVVRVFLLNFQVCELFIRAIYVFKLQTHFVFALLLFEL